MKQIIVTFLIFITATSLWAGEKKQDNPEKIKVIPLFQYDYLSLESRTIHSPGGGLVLMSEDVMFVGTYRSHSLETPPEYGYPSHYNTVDSLLDGRAGRHQYIGIFKSESDMPVKGGLRTFQTGAAYGYELIQGKNFSFVAGGGFAVGDFGIDMSEGNPLYIIPIPLLRMKYNSRWFKSSFDFLTTPNLDFTIGPRSQFRLTGDVRMEQFRDSRDILYEFALKYRFFPSNHEMGDFAGIALGIKNDNYGAFDMRSSFESALPPDEDLNENLEIHYNAVFAQIDITLLKLTAGYAFNGRDLYREEIKHPLGSGYFVSVEGLYQF